MRHSFLIVLFSLAASTALPAHGADLIIDTTTYFDAITSYAIGPPYPTDGRNIRVLHAGPGMIESDGTVTLGLAEVRSAGGEQQRADIETVGSSFWTSLAVFDLYAIGQSQEFPVDSFFDVFFDINTGTSTPNDTPAELLPVREDLPVGDPGRYFHTRIRDSFFDLTFRVDFGTEGPHQLTLHCQCQDGYELTSVGASQDDPGTADSFFDLFVELHRFGTTDYDQPLMHCEMTGYWADMPVPAAGSTWGALKRSFTRD